jgi:histidinol-phosphatase
VPEKGMTQIMTELGERLDFALTLLAAAEREITPRFRACAARTKSDGTEVTDADLAAEEAIRALLAKTCPGEAILGEEFGGDDQAERTWILDPIDGTQAFALGLPTFGTLIGYVERGEPVLGIIGLPGLAMSYRAATGLGCTKREGGEDQRVRASNVSALADAYTSGTSLLKSSVLDADGLDLGAMVARSRRFRFVGDCLQHAWVCSGRLDAALDLIVAPWDVAAVIPCVREAGGDVASAIGQRNNLLHAGSLISASTPALTDEIVGALKR